MHRIDSVGALATAPTPNAPGAVAGYFNNAAPGPGVVPTISDADWCTMLQEELASILAAASITPVKGTYNQVLAAIRALIAAPHVAPASARSAQGITLGASYHGTCTVSFTAPVAGYVVAVAGLNINTATPTAAITGSLTINGTSVGGDSTLGGISEVGQLAVASGAAVTVTFTVTTTTNPSVQADYFVTAMFFPYP